MPPIDRDVFAKPIARGCALVSAAGGGACTGVQSVHAPGGPHADAIGLLGLVMYAGGAAIFLLVLVLTIWAIAAPAERRAWLGRPAVVVVGGLAFPIVVLTALLVYGLAVAGAITRPAPAGAMRVEVTGEQFWWRVAYLAPDGTKAVRSANEIRIPVGRPVEFVLRSADVIHSFWVPSLGGKLDMIPGRTNRLVLQADRPGIYRGQCAEYCGAQHALMAFAIVAEEPRAFEDWLKRESGPAAEPGDSALARGRAVFMATGCGACHTIRGTGAQGTLGPDLTHVGGRRTLAAGTLPNNRGTMSAWIVGSQEIKPGNPMPSFDILEGPDLAALAAYLESLK